ncbi:unnamed protein product [Protopolystoma xenopodis]|uniref:Uncharacterized protein n=1 Tax=Protopolystoma xenopodis TaxID=117903 RepID=A0A3S5BTL4_9PLAT|nr:unnamed protein product [Protopolystoma xenopodis]
MHCDMNLASSSSSAQGQSRAPLFTESSDEASGDGHTRRPSPWRTWYPLAAQTVFSLFDHLSLWLAGERARRIDTMLAARKRQPHNQPFGQRPANSSAQQPEPKEISEAGKTGLGLQYNEIDPSSSGEIDQRISSSFTSGELKVPLTILSQEIHQNPVSLNNYKYW